MAAIVSAITWLLGKIFADKALSFIAIKVISVTLVVVILPIVLNNLVYDLLEVIINVVNSRLSTGSLESASIAVTGVASWLFRQAKIIESFSVITSALVVRASLNMIPFVRL